MIKELLEDRTSALAPDHRTAVYGFLYKLHEPVEAGIQTILTDGDYEVYRESLEAIEVGRVFISVMSNVAYLIRVSEPEYVERLVLAHIEFVTGCRLSSVTPPLGLFSSKAAKAAYKLKAALDNDLFTVGLILSTQLSLDHITDEIA